MAENSAIEWCDHTLNPWIGCEKISPGCDHCYAETFARTRMGAPELWQGARRRTAEATWKQAHRWNHKAAAKSLRYRVFCASLADVFDNQAPEEWRADLWSLICATPNLDWLLLTKRPQNIAKMLPRDWGEGYANVWLGTTVENQVEADRRIPHLLAVPARVRFLSCEPMLGQIDLSRLNLLNAFGILRPVDSHFPKNYFDALRGKSDIHPVHGAEPAWGKVDWVICGGESGPGARPMHPAWARDLRNQCAAAGVPFLFKQWGESLPDDQKSEKHFYGSMLGREPAVRFPDGLACWRVGKKAAGRLLDGRVHDGYPQGGPSPAKEGK